jgi:hypothetical protein
MMCGYLKDLNQDNCKIALLLLFSVTCCEAQRYTDIHHFSILEVVYLFFNMFCGD